MLGELGEEGFGEGGEVGLEMGVHELGSFLEGFYLGVDSQYRYL